MADAHKNFAASLVATAPSPATSGTSLVVTAAEGGLFPAVPFNATVWPAGTQPTAANAEVVRVTNIATDTLTITRTQESSSARTVVVGDQIAATITAKTLTDAEAAGGVVKLYDYTVAGSDAASIDTNVDGTTVANFAGYDLLEVWVIGRTDLAAAMDSFTMILNNDTGANYDRAFLQGFNGATSAGTSLAQTSWSFNTHGSSGTANYAGAVAITFPGYAATTFYKTGEHREVVVDGTAGNNVIGMKGIGYRDTAAITRVKIAGVGGAKFKIGSRLIVYGR